MSAQIMLQGVFVPLHTSEECIATPDVPYTWKVNLVFWIAYRILQFFRFQFLEHIRFDVLIIFSSVCNGLFWKLQWVFIKLRIKRHPPISHRSKNGISHMFIRPFVFGNGIV